MFSTLFYNAFGNHIKLTTIFGGSPFLWKRKKKKLIVIPETRLWHFLHTLGLFSATAYGGVRTISIKLWGRPEDVGFCLALFLSAIFDCGFAMMIFLQPDYSASVVNAMFKYWTGFCSKLKILNGKVNILRDLLHSSPHPPHNFICT